MYRFTKNCINFTKYFCQWITEKNNCYLQILFSYAYTKKKILIP